MRQRAAWLLAAALLGALCFWWGVRTGSMPARRPAPETMSPAELTWAAEGIMEQISALEDQLARVRALMGQQ